MSTSNGPSKMRKGAGLSALSVLVWLLIALTAPVTASLSSIAFAASSARLATTLPTQDVTRAGVAVVRLVVGYTAGTTADTGGASASNPAGNGANASSRMTVDIPHAPVQSASCTGLGIIVGSWFAPATEKNTWVLTSGSLLNNGKLANCAAAMPLNPVLSTVKLFPSTTYNTGAQPEMITGNALAIQCSKPSCTATDPVLFSYHSDNLYPYSDFSTKDMSQVAYLSLTSANVTVPQVSPAPTLASTFLTPLHSAVETIDALEPGTPIVNTLGELTGLHLKTATNVSATDVASLVSNATGQIQLAHTNLVHNNWVAGINALYKNPPDYTGARTNFQAAASANPAFQGARTLLDQTKNLQATATASAPATPVVVQTPTSGLSFFTTFSPLSWAIIAIGIIVFIVLLVMLSRMYSGARRSQRLKEDLVEAERLSRVDVQRIAALEAQPRGPQPQSQAAMTQQLQPTLHLPPVQQPAPANNAVVRANTPPAPAAAAPAATFLCPNCGATVQRGLARCPNCRQPFSLSDSGFFRRVQQPLVPPTPVALPLPPSPMPPTPSAMPPAPAAQPAPVNAIPDFPTVEIAPASPLRQSKEMSPVKHQQADSEKTLVSPPLAAQQVRLNRLGFAVGTRSDPGIKRKFKPNEDSFFAAEGLREGSAAMQQFGLFVVADGMGGHANGQDASRRAIQAIIEYVLPRLTRSGDANDEQFAQLLVTGIQKANEEVHRHNQEEHADTGTTVTAALVVGMTAYVANVGDSRTYLYREGEGLRKVTSDHSVVASLVQAGIIKADDIYTHPKRNQIYRSLGEKPAVDVDYFIEHLQIGDKLLLCSDGLWDMVRDPRIESVLKSPAPDPNMTGEALIHAALEGGGEDNVSVIVVQVINNPVSQGKIGVQLINKSDTVQMV